MLIDDNQFLILHFLYLGMIIAMVLCSSLFAVTSRETSYCYYIGQIAFLGGAHTLENELFYQYFWPDFSHSNLSLWPIFMGLSLSFGYLFARRFLSTKEFLPKFDTMLLVLLVVTLVVSVIAAIAPQWLLFQLTRLLALVGAVFAVYAGLRRWRQDYRPARFYLFAWICLVTSSFEGMFSGSAGPSYFDGVTWSVHLVTMLAVVLFAFALADRVYASHQENETALLGKLTEADKVMRLTDTFNRFVPHTVIQHLNKEHIVEIRLGDHVQQEMSVLVMEIRDFSTISELMSPAENLDFINQFLKEMGPIIRNHNGFVRKYKAAGITALFPHKPEDAIAAARSMLKRLKRLNQDKKENQASFEIGIGIHTAVIMLGIIGEVGRMEGTVVNDAEHLAEHVQELTKSYQRPMLASEYTHAALENANDPLIEFVDRSGVPGKSGLIDIYEVKKKPWE